MSEMCFYHAKAAAQANCMGCKMPICQACQDAGKNGFCETCMRRVAVLGSQITDIKKTGMVTSTHKATMIKSSSRPTSQKNVTYCFQHFDMVATGTCPSCNRAFCQECFDASGSCSHCARLARSQVQSSVQPRRSPTGALPPEGQAPMRPRTPTGTLKESVAHPPPPPRVASSAQVSGVPNAPARARTVAAERKRAVISFLAVLAVVAIAAVLYKLKF